MKVSAVKAFRRQPFFDVCGLSQRLKRLHHFPNRGGSVETGIGGSVETGMVVQLKPKKWFSWFRNIQIVNKKCVILNGSFVCLFSFTVNI